MPAPEQGWRSTGYTQLVDSAQMDRIPAYNPRSGDHLWSWAVLYRAAPGVETPMLDAENLLSIAGIGCYYCEQGYTDRLAKRRCPGDPAS